MKKYIIIVSVVVLLFLAGDFCWFRLGWYIDFNPQKPVEAFAQTEDESILLTQNGKKETFYIKGVDIGSSTPGKWSTEYAIDKETYLRWFEQIQDMGANTIRIYTVYGEAFYDALYEYNKDNEHPLWLLQGVRIDDYTLNNRVSGTDDSFLGQFIKNSTIAVDVIHGRRKITLSKKGVLASGNYTKDVSEWVLGYIIGDNWDPTTVAYTNEMYGHMDEWTSYEGEYMSAKANSKPFEVVLAKIGDEVLKYESRKYKTQRLIAFSNHPITDPFIYNQEIRKYFTKVSEIDVDQIVCTKKVISGQFASYHAYPYFPDFLRYMDDWSPLGLNKDEYTDGNTYRAYLTALTNHHTMPVVISEFGTSTARTMSYRERDDGRNSGLLTEQEQGEVLKRSYEDIVASGANGACVFSWNDEWCKRTWNTMHAVNTKRSAFWSDFQTGEQFFGLMALDPGEKESVCYVDGDVSEWKEEDKIISGDTELSVKYDEKFIYFLVKKEDINIDEDVLYIPFDITPKSGSSYCENMNLKFERAVDFLMVIDGKDNSRVLVQERYDALRSTYSTILYRHNTYQKERMPDQSSPKFVEINLLLEKIKFEDRFVGENFIMEMQGQGNEEILENWGKPVTFETGRLTYGNANPNSENFNSIADFIACGEYIEIRLPWQLLNFADPSRMTIHDDYYNGNYGVDYISIDEMYVGIAETESDDRIPLYAKELKGWGNDVTYHERLKSSYYVMQSIWRETDEG